MLDAYRDLIDELLDTPAVVRGAVDAADEGATSSEVKQLIAAWRDRDRAVLARVKIMTRQETPYLRAFDVLEPAMDEPLPDVLSEMETARGDLVSLLMNLSLKDWERRAIHDTAGEISLADEVEQHVEFDEAQRRRLQELLSGT